MSRSASDQRKRLEPNIVIEKKNELMPDGKIINVGKYYNFSVWFKSGLFNLIFIKSSYLIRHMSKSQSSFFPFMLLICWYELKQSI
jgi:hypothetical protein